MRLGRARAIGSSAIIARDALRAGESSLLIDFVTSAVTA
jgi:hypothetical protein